MKWYDVVRAGVREAPQPKTAGVQLPESHLLIYSVLALSTPVLAREHLTLTSNYPFHTGKRKQSVQSHSSTHSHSFY